MAARSRLPVPLGAVGCVLGLHCDLVRYQEGTVEADPELADQIRIPL